MIAGIPSFVPSLVLAQGQEVLPEQSDSLWEIVTSGGIPGLLILLVLLGLSVAAVYLAIDQFLSLRHDQFVPEGLAAGVAQALQNGKMDQAEKLIADNPSVLAGLLRLGLSRRQDGWAEVEKSIEDALLDHSAALHRRIDYLSMIANLAPMVGLLGTVTGMIFAFRQVAVTSGAAGAGDLAEGIYQALVTTVGGLLVAIPSLAVSSVLRNRVDTFMSEVTRHAETGLRPLRRRAAAVGATDGPGGRLLAVPPAQLQPRSTKDRRKDG